MINCVSLPLEKSVDSSLGGLSRSSTVASLDTDSTKSSSQSLLFPSSIPLNPLPLSQCFNLFPTKGNSASETCAEFRVKYVGAIEKLQFSMSKTLQEPLELITYIDAAQVRNGRNELEVVKLKRNTEKCSFVLTARWEASLRAGGQGDDSGRVQVWSQSGLVGPVCE